MYIRYSYITYIHIYILYIYKVLVLHPYTSQYWHCILYGTHAVVFDDITYYRETFN